MKSQFQALVFFGLFFVAGFYFFYQAEDQARLDRDPASVKNSFDLSMLQGEELSATLTQRLASDLQVSSVSSDKYLRFNQFKLMVDGKKKWLCEEYSKVVFQFEALGVDVSGHKSEMQVDGPCVSSAEEGKVDPLIIPVSKLIVEKVADGEFNYREGKYALVTFANLENEWPKKWSLKSFRLINPTTGAQVTVTAEKVSKSLGSPFVLEF